MRVLACALLVITTANAFSFCEPGDSINDGHNVCHCIGDGFGWICTPVDRRGSPAVIETREGTATEKACEPGQLFNDYCNTCRCGPDGRTTSSVCTQMDCDPNVWNKDGTLKDSTEVIERSLPEELKTCEPGTTFKEYCNTCSCGTNGRPACTRMYCDPKVWNRDGTLKNSVKVVKRSLSEELKTCEPGTIFKEYCNTCSCGTNGRPACTRMYCDPKVWNRDGTLKNSVKVVKRSLSEELKTCEPGTTFKEYCNTCSCGTNGRPACTRMYCDPKVWNRDGTLKNSVKVVKRSLSEELKTCEPGTTFKEYCNTCSCGTNGRPACTRMYCDPKVWNRDGTLKNSVKVVKRSLSEELKTCEPGTTFKEYCNTCSCGTNGRPACTRMYCDPKVWNRDGTLKNSAKVIKRSLSEELKTCKPGTTFKEYCNTCSCGTNGRPACTRMYCDPKVWNRDGTLKDSVKVIKRSSSEELKTCEPGTTFKEYCNTCSCGTNGRPACTRMYCDPKVWNRDGTLKNSVKVVKRSLAEELKTCEPGTTFKEYCNTCSCGTNGRPACTRMYCDPKVWNRDGTLKNSVKVVKRSLSEELKTCEPGTTFKEYCNTCSCGTNGRPACTRMYCDPKVWNRDGTLKNSVKVVKHFLSEELKTCEPGTTFKEYCNTCSCGTNGRPACTRMYCDPNVWNKDGSMKMNMASNPLLREERSTDFLCQPERIFKDECNTCFCGKDGKTFRCTLMNCPPRKDGPVVAPQVCEPNEHFMIECNKCMCNSDGTRIACTKMACHSVAKRSVCKPNSTFKKDCNTCTCNSDGTRAACTLLACIESPKKVCEPNSTFKKDCNVCTCNSDGTSAACTLLACNESTKKICQPNSTFKNGCNTCRCNSDGTHAACTLVGC